MSAATDDIFSDTILQRIHSLYLHRCLHHFYPNIIEVDSYYSTTLFSNEPVLVTKVCWILHEGRIVKRVYWVELIDELPPYAISETPPPFLPPLVPLSPPPAPSPASPTSPHSSSGSKTIVPGQDVPIKYISEDEELEWNDCHSVPELSDEDKDVELLYPSYIVNPSTL